MAQPTPETARLKIVMTNRGLLRALYDGEPIAGVIKIECNHELGSRAIITLTFIGPSVNFETEPDEVAAKAEG
jgi:hypothetical protein